jgi:hypothetical protein
MNPRQHAVSLLRFVRSISDGILKGFPDDKLTYQTSPADNHVLWTLGHLASTDVWIAGAVGAQGAAFPETYQPLFGQGSKPVSDPKKYPPLTELRTSFDDNRAAVLAWLESAPDSTLSVNLKDKTGGFASDPIDAALKLAWHEGWHMGQVATLRKALGLPPVMG